MTKQEKQKLWIGIGIGATVGIGTGFVIGHQTAKRKARRDIKKLRHQAYLKGLDDATEEAKKVIDDLTNNVVLVDSTDPEVIKKAVEDHFNAQSDGAIEESSDSADAPNGAFLWQTEASEEDNTASAKQKAENDDKTAQNSSSHVYPDDIYAEKTPVIQYDLPDELNFIGVGYDGTNITFANGDQPPLSYPKWLFLNNNGDMRDVTSIREDLKRYDHTIRNLCVVWNRLGWGTYVMDLDSIAEDEDIASYDVDIDDTTLGDEPMEKTLERQKYLDEIDRYIAHPEEAPQIISRDEFQEEAYLDQRLFDYYEVDNVFVESNDVNKPVDAVTLFGTNNGQELFDRKADSDDDPDVVYVKNFKMNSVMEITRWHKSYASIVDGSAYIHDTPN